MPTVYSRRRKADPPPEGAVYVGRPSPWGNLFTVGEDGDRREVVEKFRAWAYAPEQEEYRRRVREELRGKDLICWCRSPSDFAPLPCHAMVLLAIANSRRVDANPTSHPHTTPRPGLGPDS